MSASRWRYVLDSPFEVSSKHLEGVYFSNEWLHIENNTLRIEKGYAWDGCSPAWKLGYIWIGTWDGPLLQDGRPAAFYASLVHDALTQFGEYIPITTEATIDLFVEMLAARNFPHMLIPLYATALRLFGPRHFGLVVRNLNNSFTV